MVPRILLVDDDRDVRESLLTAIVHHGYDVVTAVNGEDGLRKFLHVIAESGFRFLNEGYWIGPEFCCVVTDINMPIMDGQKMVTEILSLKPEQKIVIMTGDPYFKFLGHPEIPVLYKPFRMVELTNLLPPISCEKGELPGRPNALMDFELP